MRQKPVKIDAYDALLQHQQAERTWRYHPVVAELQRFAKIFQNEFGLAISGPLAIGVGEVRQKCGARQSTRHGAMGLKRELVISSEVVQGIARNGEAPEHGWCQVLATLLHALLHLHEETAFRAKTPGYHSVFFQSRAADLGIGFDPEDGVLIGTHPSPFTLCISANNIAIPELVPLAMPDKAKKTKLRPYVCGCSRCWAAVRDFTAICGLCHQPFIAMQRH